MARSRTVIIAGAGIGGLTTALTLAKVGLRALVIEQAHVLEEAGAGIQLSPNATRVLTALGLADKLKPYVVAPDAVRVISADGDEIVRIPFGDAAAFRYGAPYWVVHRADLQAVLLAAAQNNAADIELRFGARVEDFAVHANGVTVATSPTRLPGGRTADSLGVALIGADGLWSTLRARMFGDRPPVFAERTAWRAVVPADKVAPALRLPVVHLWLGPNAHLVHYPIKAGAAINIVAIIGDTWNESGWSTLADPREIIARFAGWASPARDIVGLPRQWLKWALFDRPPLAQWGDGPVTLLGDAAHPMLPFLAQGGAMAIEDAAIVAKCLAADVDRPAEALRLYERLRRGRTSRMQAEARANGRVYHLSGLPALMRNLVLGARGGPKLVDRYDWIYDWRSE